MMCSSFFYCRLEQTLMQGIQVQLYKSFSHKHLQQYQQSPDMLQAPIEWTGDKRTSESSWDHSRTHKEQNGDTTNSNIVLKSDEKQETICVKTEAQDLENLFSISMETNSDATTIEDVSNMAVVSGQQGEPIDVTLQVNRFDTQKTRQHNYI